MRFKQLFQSPKDEEGADQVPVDSILQVCVYFFNKGMSFTGYELSRFYFKNDITESVDDEYDPDDDDFHDFDYTLTEDVTGFKFFVFGQEQGKYESNMVYLLSETGKMIDPAVVLGEYYDVFEKYGKKLYDKHSENAIEWEETEDVAVRFLTLWSYVKEKKANGIYESKCNLLGIFSLEDIKFRKI